MKKIIRLWGLLRLILRNLRARQSVREVLYLLTSLEEMPPDKFSQGIGTWSKRITTLQPYLYRDLQTSRLPDDLTLIDDYRRIINRIEEEIASFRHQPLITFILPVYSGSSDLIESTLRSIRQQLYQRFEIYLLVDSKRHAELERLTAAIFQNSQTVILKEFVDVDTKLESAFNEVLNECRGEFIAFISSSDTIARESTLEVARLINQSPDVEIIYSDESKKAGEYTIRSFRKPGWSRDLFCSLNYTQNFLCCRKEAVRNTGGLSGSFESDIKHDLILRMIEQREQVHHVPKVLYHEEVFKNYPQGYNADRSLQLQEKSLEAHLRRLGIDAEVTDGLIKGSFRVRRHIKPQEKISIIIPTRDRIHFLEKCIESIESKSTFRNYEIIIIDNGSLETASAEYFAGTRYRVIRNSEEFNYSRLNNIGAGQATGEHLLFLNNDTEVIAPDWLEALLEHSQRAEVGAVGAKLLYPNGLIQHAGMVLGGRFVAEHTNRFAEIYDRGYHGLADVVRNFNSVTGACLMMRTRVFQEIGGFDERLAVTYNDVDLCLKARACGYLVVYTPYAILYHHEGLSVLKNDESETASIEMNLNGQSTMHQLRVPKGQAKEIELFYSRWKSFIENDVNYNPQLTRCAR